MKPLTIQFTQLENTNGQLTKSFQFDQETNTIKEYPEPIFYRGLGLHKTINFSDFPAYINSLNSRQAITLGVIPDQSPGISIPIVPKNELENARLLNPSTISRTRDNFKLNGLCVFDINTVEDGPSIQALIDGVYNLANLDDKDTVLCQSNGTGIYDKITNNCVISEQRCHIFFIAKNIGNIKTYVEILKKRAWLLGYGYIHISETGKQSIKNYLFDEISFSPERVNYIANANCSESLYQKRQIEYYDHDNGIVSLSTTNMNSLKLGKREELKYNMLVNQAKNEIKKEIKKESNINKENRITNILATPENTLNRNQLYDKLNFKICKDDILNFDEFGLVKVSDIFEDSKKYHSALLSDPLDSENNKGKAKLYTLTQSGNPQYPFIINSFFNDGQKYKVYNNLVTEHDALSIVEDVKNNKIDKNDPKAIEAFNVLKDNENYNELTDDIDVNAEMSLEASKQAIVNNSDEDQLIHIFINNPEILSTNNYVKIAKLIDNEASNNPESLIFRDDNLPLIITQDSKGSISSQLTIQKLRASVCLYRPDKNNKYKFMKTSRDVAETFLTFSRTNVKRLKKIINNPYLNHEFEVVVKHKYIPELEMYQDPINSDVGYDKTGWSIDRSKKSLNWLCDTLFSKFHFESELDMMGAVGALLTGISIPIVNGFPGFLITAKSANTGKSTLTNMIDNLLNNEITPIREYNQNKVELDKYISSALLKKRPVISFDNLKTGMTIDSTKLMALITGEVMEVRVIGTLDVVNLDANALYLFNGIDIKMTSDFDTRLIAIHLKPSNNYKKKINEKDRRKSKDKINKLILDNRNEIICSLFDIMLAGKDYDGLEYDDNDRFEDWNKFVCAPIHNLTGLDIRKLSNSNIRQSDLYNFVFELFNEFGNKFVTSSTIIDKCFDTNQQLTILGNTLQNLIGEDQSPNDNTCDRITPSFVTSCLKRHMDTQIKGFKLNFTNKINHTGHWKVQEQPDNI